MLKRITIFLGSKLISFYQLVISPLLGTSGKCLHQPTCSEYAKEAIAQYGLIHGSWLAGKRILRCNPACTCGVDPVPHKFKHKQVKENESN